MSLDTSVATFYPDDTSKHHFLRRGFVKTDILKEVLLAFIAFITSFITHKTGHHFN